ncbi:hypothetical protein CEXT_638241 [Caerostris extrusa]|uniref:Uncharacterized protein n=1 Tax=Caerostris extrusa TaxID=172846 RepID=A0AAV4XDY8_CAEEX|nr:hypothetical protein CEXT_638241 [Caerostris extrusa]
MESDSPRVKKSDYEIEVISNLYTASVFVIHVRAAHDRADVRLQLHRIENVEAHSPRERRPLQGPAATHGQDEGKALQPYCFFSKVTYSNLRYMYP